MNNDKIQFSWKLILSIITVATLFAGIVGTWTTVQNQIVAFEADVKALEADVKANAGLREEVPLMRTEIDRNRNVRDDLIQIKADVAYLRLAVDKLSQQMERLERK